MHHNRSQQEQQVWRSQLVLLLPVLLLPVLRS
jgi:hypothetical protein